MEMTKLMNRLIKHWQDQGIEIIPKPLNEVEDFEALNQWSLPNDFKQFYSRVNGMSSYFPNEIDDEGFLFYPLESILPSKQEFEGFALAENHHLYIFADYMHKSWWYGVEIKPDGKYLIGIIPDKLNFKPITDSLSEFIALYIENSSKLYDYN